MARVLGRRGFRDEFVVLVVLCRSCVWGGGSGVDGGHAVVAIVMTMWFPCSCYISASNSICFHPLSLCLEPGLFRVWMVYLCRPSCVLVVEGEHPRA